MPDASEQIHALSPMPPHLWQLNPNVQVTIGGLPKPANNNMGCGAYSTTMCVSAYDSKYGSYQTAADFYARMAKVPFSRGTWEGENSTMARKLGFVSAQLHNGTPQELADLIAVNAPAVLNIDPQQILFIKYGAHDVPLVGYSEDGVGKLLKLFVLDPWIEGDSGSIGGHPEYPGNRYFAATDADPGEKLTAMWTGTFTPVFRDRDHAQQWLAKHPARVGSFGI